MGNQPSEYDAYADGWENTADDGGDVNEDPNTTNNISDSKPADDSSKFRRPDYEPALYVEEVAIQPAQDLASVVTIDLLDFDYKFPCPICKESGETENGKEVMLSVITLSDHMGRHKYAAVMMERMGQKYLEERNRPKKDFEKYCEEKIAFHTKRMEQKASDITPESRRDEMIQKIRNKVDGHDRGRPRTPKQESRSSDENEMFVPCNFDSWGSPSDLVLGGKTLATIEGNSKMSKMLPDMSDSDEDFGAFTTITPTSVVRAPIITATTTSTTTITAPTTTPTVRDKRNFDSRRTLNDTNLEAAIKESQFEYEYTGGMTEEDLLTAAIAESLAASNQPK